MNPTYPKKLCSPPSEFDKMDVEESPAPCTSQGEKHLSNYLTREDFLDVFMTELNHIRGYGLKACLGFPCITSSFGSLIPQAFKFHRKTWCTWLTSRDIFFVAPGCPNATLKCSNNPILLHISFFDLAFSL